MRRKILFNLIAALAVALAACNQLRPQPGPTPPPPTRAAPSPAPQPTGGSQSPSPTATTAPTALPKPTATPRPLGNPILIDRAPLGGEELAADKPLVLTFDQPMDRASVEAAFSVGPVGQSLRTVTGKFDWRNDTTLAFTPNDGWGRASRYDARLTEAAKSAKGLALNKPQQFEFNTLGALRVAQTIPADGAKDVGADATVTVLFNRPVVPLTSATQQSGLPNPLSFTPAIEGKGEWLNTSAYVFRPSAPLAAGESYRARVIADLRDASGATLDGNAEWSFVVASPAVKFVAPNANAKDVDLRQPISVTFSQKMDRASAEAAFKLSPSARGTFRWSDEKPASDNAFGAPRPRPADALAKGAQQAAQLGEVMTFVPDEDYQRATNYAFEIAAGARAKVGSGATAQPQRFGFRTIENLALASTTPANGATGDGEARQFILRFSAPVLPGTVMPNLKFEPPLGATGIYTYWEPTEKQFIINAPLKPSTQYRVGIGAGIADKYGQKLGKDAVVAFRTGALRPAALIGSGNDAGTLNAAQPSRVQIAHRNVSRLDFELARLSLDDFYALTGSPRAYELRQNFKPKPEQLVRAWSENVSGKPDDIATSVVSLDAAGGTLPTGAYMLTMTAPENTAKSSGVQPARQVLLVTNHHVALKQGGRDALAWVTNLTTGRPVPNAPVSFVDKTFKPIATATTNADGVAAVPSLQTRLASYDPFYAVVGAPGQANFAAGYNQWSDGIQPYMFSFPVDFDENLNPVNYRVYLYTDRPIYRPGQMVNFKSIVREDDDARYRLPAGLTSVPVVVRSERGAVVLSATLPVDASGSFSGSFVLDNEASTGFYSINAILPPNCRENVRSAANVVACRPSSVSFQVAAYRKPDFEVAAATDKPDYAQGERATSNIAAKYFFGGDAANARVGWNVFERDFVFDRYADASDPFSGRYSFGDADSGYVERDFRPGFDDLIARGEGATDANGKFSFGVPVDLSDRKNSARLVFEASVTDVNNQAVTAKAEAVAHKGPFYFGVATDDYVVVAGKPLTVHVVSADWQGKPLPNQAAKATLYRREWKQAQTTDAFGNAVTSYTPNDTKVGEVSLQTGGDAKAIATLTPAEGGEYRVVVENAAGNVRAATSVWVSEPGEFLPWRREDDKRISLRADKPRYNIGDTAKILVPSPFNGPVSALLTLERGGILQSRVIQLASNSDVLEIPITADLAPNAYASVLLVKGIDASNKLPDFRLGYAELDVNTDGFALKLDVKPDKASYAPRDTVTYDIRVTDASGKPAQAELSLALVDKAVLTLAEPNSEPPLQAFYAPRGLGVRTASSLAVRADVAATDKLVEARGLGGGGGGFAPDQFVRENFADTAFWRAVIATDADGRARVSVPLPDNLTTWVLDARAVTPDTKVGAARGEIVTRKPLLVRPITPRFFVVGDEAQLGAVVNNDTDADIEADVTLSASGVTLRSPDSQKIKVPAKGSARVNWQVVAGDAPLADVTFRATSGNLRDSAKPELGAGGIPILRYLSPDTAATAGDVSEPGKKTEFIALPPRLDAAKSTLDVRVDTSLAQIAASVAEELQQRDANDNLSVALRLLVNSARGTGRDVVARDAQHLLDHQRDDAGWGWFDDSAQSSPLVSAYAVWALARTKVAASDVVDEARLNRARGYVQNQLREADTLPDKFAADEQAFLLFALSEAGAKDEARLAKLFQNRDKLSHYARALLALSFNNLKTGDERIKAVLSDVYSAASASATGAMWQERPSRYAFFGTNTRSTAMILYALSRLDAKNALLPNVVRWLTAARAGNRWSSDEDSAWAALALDTFADATGERNPNYEWRVSLNDSKLMDGSAASAEISRTATVTGAQLLASQANALGLERGAGNGRLYYSAQLKSYLPVEDARALNRGIAIARKYELADCEPKPDKPCEALTSAPLGKDVRVRLTVVTPNDLYFVRITDPFAAGLEPVDPSLKVNAARAQSASRPWGWWWFSRTDLRDDQARIYADYLPAGTHEFDYVLRPTLAGTFKVMPASVTQTNFPETFGRTDGSTFTVKN